MKLKIEYIKTDELKPYANNAKAHPAEQVEQIKKSIEEFGMNDPIAIWHDNEIIEGHGRLLAATELGLDKVPVIRLDELSDEQRRAYMLVHNKLTMNTDFDSSLLEIELDSIADIDMSEYGFIQEELEEAAAEISDVSLTPYKNVHYLITADINDNDKLLEIIEQLKEMEGVEVDSALN